MGGAEPALRSGGRSPVLSRFLGCCAAWRVETTPAGPQVSLQDRPGLCGGRWGWGLETAQDTELPGSRGRLFMRDACLKESTPCSKV